MEQQPEKGTVSVSKDTLWYLDNYILLKDYFDRTVSRIAARCVRKGNIAMEEYPFYGYILDVLEEISETGEYVLDHPELYPYIEKKIPGGVEAEKSGGRGGAVAFGGVCALVRNGFHRPHVRCIRSRTDVRAPAARRLLAGRVL